MKRRPRRTRRTRKPTQQFPQQATRLKRARPNPENQNQQPPATVPATGQDDGQSAEDARKTAASIQSLRQICTAVTNDPQNTTDQALNTLLQTTLSVLTPTTSPSTLEHLLQAVPHLPRALLQVANALSDPACPPTRSPRDRARALLTCLLHLTSGDSHAGKPDQPSRPLSERAADWARYHLSSLLRGDESAFPHASTAPRHVLQTEVNHCLQARVEKSLLELGEAPAASAAPSLNAVTSGVVRTGDAALLTALVTTASQLRPPFKPDLPDAGELPDLPAETRTLVCNDSADLPDLPADTAPADTLARTDVLAARAIRGAQLHFALMDSVRRAVGSAIEPFCLWAWPARAGTRAVFATITDGLDRRIVHRLPPAFRTAVRQAVGLDGALRASRNIRAGILAALVLHNMTYAENGVSRNVQAVLICLECILERVVWACSVGIRDDCLPDGVCRRRVAEVIADLVCALAASRACDGRIVAGLEERERICEVLCAPRFARVDWTDFRKSVRLSALLAVALLAGGVAEEVRSPLCVDEFDCAEWEWACFVARRFENSFQR